MRLALASHFRLALEKGGELKIGTSEREGGGDLLLPLVTKTPAEQYY